MLNNLDIINALIEETTTGDGISARWTPGGALLWGL